MQNEKNKLSTFETLVFETKNVLDELNNNKIELTESCYTNLVRLSTAISAELVSRDNLGTANVNTIDAKLLNVLKSIALSLPKVNGEIVKIALRINGCVDRESHKKIVITRSGIPQAKLENYLPKNVGFGLTEILPMLHIGDDDENTKLYYYDFDRGVYTYNTRILKTFIFAVNDSITLFEERELMNWLMSEDHVGYSKPTKSEHLVVLGNGILDLNTYRLIPFSSKYVFLSKSDVNWNPNAKHPDFPSGWAIHQFFNEQAKSEDDVKMFWQVIQYTLLSNMAKQAFVMLYDAVGGSGKGMFAKILMNLLGSSNVGAANFKQLTDRFTLYSVYNKALIYGDENDNNYISSNEIMKSLSSGDPVSIEGKGLQPFLMSVTPMVLQSMNTTPVFKHLDGGSKRRIRILEFQHSYIGNINLDVKSKYINDTEFLEWLAFTALTMPLEPLIDSAHSQKIKGELESESNPVHAFLEESLPLFTSQKVPTNILFLYFMIWLKLQNKKTDWTNIRFIKEVKRELTTFGWSYSDTKARCYSFLMNRIMKLFIMNI